MYTTTTVLLGQPVAYGGTAAPVVTVLVPWTEQFGAAYQQFINGGYASMPYGGLGGLGGLGGFPATGFGGLGGIPATGYGGFGGIPATGYGSLGGLGGYGGLPGTPFGFGVTTS